MTEKRKTWREDIADELARHGETWADVVSVTWGGAADDTFEASQNIPVTLDSEPCWTASFTIWTRKRVYFPAIYEDHNWTDSVARDPDGVATMPVGGS